MENKRDRQRIRANCVTSDPGAGKKTLVWAKRANPANGSVKEEGHDEPEPINPGDFAKLRT